MLLSLLRFPYLPILFFSLFAYIFLFSFNRLYRLTPPVAPSPICFFLCIVVNSNSAVRTFFFELFMCFFFICLFRNLQNYINMFLLLEGWDSENALDLPVELASMANYAKKCLMLIPVIAEVRDGVKLVPVIHHSRAYHYLNRDKIFQRTQVLFQNGRDMDIYFLL